jgi:hypothetical protein
LNNVLADSIILASLYKTLELASSLVGDQPINELNEAGGPTRQRSWSEQNNYRRVTPGDRIRRLDDYNALLIYRDQPPAQLAFRALHDDKEAEAA